MDRTIAECDVRWWKWKMEEFLGKSHEPAVVFKKGEVVKVLYEYGAPVEIKIPGGSEYRYDILLLGNDEGITGCVARSKTEPVS